MEDGEEYLAALVDIARAAAAGGGVLNWRVISMAKDSNVMRRVNRILNRGLQLPKPFGRLAWVTLLACSLPVIYVSAAVRLSSVNRGSTVQEHAATMLPEQKSPATLMAQAAANQPVRPAPPPIPPRPEDRPTTMCILIDNSGSMSDKRAEVKAAALALVKQSRPRDEVCIVDFSDDIFLDLTFTSDITKMEEALSHYESRGGKAIRDAILGSIDYVEQKAHNDRKVLVLVTEGNDTSSTVSQDQLLGAVRSSGVPIYVIGLLSEKYPLQAEEAKLALGELAEASRGVVDYPKDLADVESVSAEIANKIRRQ
jgi:Mg-chelatase subunit ChlD